MKTIDQVEYWGKSEWETIAGIAVKFPKNKKVDYVCMRSMRVETEFYQVFAELSDMKFNWLIKLWGKLNGIRA